MHNARALNIYSNLICFRRKKIKDIDESKWETSADGTVVKRQPGAGNDQGGGSGGPYIQRYNIDIVLKLILIWY